MDKELEKNLSARNVLRVELVAAYVRVSTTEQKLHGLSLDAQRAKLISYAEEHNLKIVEWYVDEGISAAKLIRKRPELQRMIQDAEQRKFERIIFIKLDRFFRSVAEYHECMKRISPVIWTATEEKYDLSTAQGRALVNFKLTIGELEAGTAGERVDLVNEYKVTTGQPLSGSMPFGFKIVTDQNTGRKKIIRDPDDEDILEDMIQHYMTHQSKKGTIVYANAVHHVSISHDSLTRLLSNTMLMGAYRDNPKYCEAYLTPEEFDKLQGIMNRNVKDNTAENRAYIFSGLIRCPECGCILKGTTNVQWSRDKSIKYVYKRYRCGKSKKDAACDFKKTISENAFERMMLANIEKYMEDAKLRVTHVDDSNKAKVPKHNIEEIHDRIDRLNYSWQTGKIRKVEQYEKDYAELMELLEQAEAEQSKVEVKDFGKIEAILHSGWEGIYNNLDDAYKRAFWRSFIQSIEIYWTTKKKEITRVNFY
jgi:DNA invertase Pin-like site-specific DNA recombinase